MGSALRRSHRAWLLKVGFVLAMCFAAGLVTAGVVSGAGPLSILSTDTETTTASETTEETTTDGTETGTEPSETEPTETEPTEPTPTETEPTEPTTTEPAPTTPPTDPSIVADKEDYVPEEWVALLGEGWQPGESVHVFVNDDEGQTWSHHTDVTADELGAFETYLQLPSWFVATYSVTATGASGAVETTSFADSVAVDGSSTNSSGGSGPGSQQIALSAPAVSTGDVLVVQIVIADAISNTFICPATGSGWATIRKNSNSSNTILQETFWLRAAAASGIASHTFAFRTSSCSGALIGTGTKGASGGVVRFTGVVASGDPVDISAPTPNSGSSSGPFTAPNVITSVPNTHILRFFGAFKNITINPSSGRIYHVASSATKERTAAGFDGGLKATAGGAGTGTFTASFSSSAEFVSQTVALKPGVAVVSDAPVVNSPICAGATSVSGTSTEANGTSIEVFKGVTSLGTTTVTGGVWTKTGLPALAAGDAIKARATATGETVSVDSNVVTVVSCNAAPAAPANPAQFRSNGTTAIALGGFTNEPTVVLKGDVSDPDTNDSVKLEVEVKPVGTPFDGTGLVAGSNVTEPATASANVSGLANGGYHWRARAVDDDSASGGWTSFGPNAETDADFTVDTVKPILTASATSPPPGPAYAAGTWTNDDVKVAFDCQDPGSGVGTDTVPDVTVTTEGANQSVTSTGICADNAGNQADPATFSDIDIDKTAPLVNCGAADGNWHATDVSIACTAGDGALSGLASSGDAAFSLTTSVPAGTETANAATDSRVVSDNAGNSTTAGPIGGNKVDKKDPAVTCTVPDQSAWYGANVSVACTASDGGSGLANAADASFSLTTTVAAGAEDATASTGSHTVADGVGNDDTVGPYVFKVDRKDPTVSCTVPDQSVWYAANVTVNCTASDSGSGLANAADASFSLTTTVPAGTEDATASTGSQTVADGVGNDDNVGPYVFKVDRKDPTVSCTVPDQSVWYAANVTVNCTASDSGSGLANASDASFTLQTSVPAGSEDATASTGTHTVADTAGNDDTVGPYVFKVDRKAPQLSGCDAADGNWHADDVTLECTYTDGGSGPASQQVSLSTDVPAGTETANAAASADGAQACDAVSNCAASPADIGGNKVDKKDPAVTCTVPDQSVWYGANVSVACTASDGGSGLANAADASFSLTTTVPAGAEDATASTGSHTVADGVGNDDTVGPYVFKVDRKDPTVSCTVPDQSVWYAANVTVNCTASDSGSGLANAADASFSLTTTVPAGTEDATASTGSHTVADGVGNDDTVGPYVFKVDRRAPSVLCGSADGAWHSTDVSIACTASDGGSGLGSGSDASFNLTTSVPAGTETSSASTGTRVVADAVGNSTTAGPITGNKVDKKGPVVTLSCASTVVLGSSATASWTAADGGSGVKPGYGSGTIALDTSSIGPKTATAPAGTSQDNVDNPSPAASCGYSVVFDFEGFFQPVDNGGVLNVVQAGRAIPLKFSLGGNQGLNIFATLYPKSTVIPCDGSSGTDVLEETMTAGSSSLQYDAGSDQYHYVWKTEKTWASSCRRLDLKFVDGTIRSALFNFKK